MSFDSFNTLQDRDNAPELSARNHVFVADAKGSTVTTVFPESRRLENKLEVAPIF